MSMLHALPFNFCDIFFDLLLGSEFSFMYRKSKVTPKIFVTS